MIFKHGWPRASARRARRRHELAAALDELLEARGTADLELAAEPRREVVLGEALAAAAAALAIEVVLGRGDHVRAGGAATVALAAARTVLGADLSALAAAARAVVLGADLGALAVAAALAIEVVLAADLGRARHPPGSPRRMSSRR